MNRCIHCTRCIRFGEEVAGLHEMVAVQRGNNTEITTIDGRPLETDYAGNYSDICPTGSLTLKDFRFKKRAWYLKKTATVCEGCSRGCNMEIHQESNRIYRCLPRENMEINKYWLCDEGRFNYHYVHDQTRVTEPAVGGGSGLALTEWNQAIDAAKSAVAGAKGITVLVGSDLTQEEAQLLQAFVPQHLKGAQMFHYGTPGVKTTQDDAAADKILKRKSKTSNLHGLEKLGFKPFESLPTGTDTVVVFRGGRAQLPELKGAKAVGVGVFGRPQADRFAAVLPGASFAEKDGTIVNFQGKEQRIKRAILPPGQSKALSEILMMWANRKG
jgi:NADH-quinone oxidoreductase subunit G